MTKWGPTNKRARKLRAQELSKFRLLLAADIHYFREKATKEAALEYADDDISGTKLSDLADRIEKIIPEITLDNYKLNMEIWEIYADFHHIEEPLRRKTDKIKKVNANSASMSPKHYDEARSIFEKCAQSFPEANLSELVERTLKKLATTTLRTDQRYPSKRLVNTWAQKWLSS